MKNLLQRTIAVLGIVALLGIPFIASSEPEGPCSNIGQYLPDNMYCDSYYICDKELIAVPYRCPATFAFHRTNHTCVVNHAEAHGSGIYCPYM